MIDAASRFLERASRGWVVIAVIALFAFYIAAVLPVQSAKAERYSGEVGTPDSSFFYTANDIYVAAAAFGADGRSEYVLARVTFDVAWPLVYGVFLSVVLSWLAMRCFAEGDRWRRLNLLPWLAVGLDYLENFAAAVTVGRYPATTPVLADVASVFTVLKWLVLSAAFVLVLVLGVLAVVRRSRLEPVTS